MGRKIFNKFLTNLIFDVSYFATNATPSEFAIWNEEEGRNVIRDVGFGEAYYNKVNLSALSR